MRISTPAVTITTPVTALTTSQYQKRLGRSALLEYSNRIHNIFRIFSRTEEPASYHPLTKDKCWNAWTNCQLFCSTVTYNDSTSRQYTSYSKLSTYPWLVRWEHPGHLAWMSPHLIGGWWGRDAVIVWLPLLPQWIPHRMHQNTWSTNKRVSILPGAFTITERKTWQNKHRVSKWGWEDRGPCRRHHQKTAEPGGSS